jgi:hypothetical protein
MLDFSRHPFTADREMAVIRGDARLRKDGVENVDSTVYEASRRPARDRGYEDSGQYPSERLSPW